MSKCAGPEDVYGTEAVPSEGGVSLASWPVRRSWPRQRRAAVVSAAVEGTLTVPARATPAEPMVCVAGSGDGAR